MLSVNEILLQVVKLHKLILLDPCKLKELDKINITGKNTILSNINSNKCEESEMIEASLYIEERFSNHGPFNFLCHPNWTVWTVKNCIEKQFSKINCPSGSLFLLSGHSILEDHIMLKQYGIAKYHDPLYVYLKRDSKMEALSTNDAPKQCSLFCQTISNGSTCLSCLHNEENTPTTQEVIDPNPCSHTIKNKESFLGWTCPACTYNNEPTRPGCFICSGPRPSDYQLPDNHTPSSTEKLRIAQELQVEKLTTLAMHEKLKNKQEKRNFNYVVHVSATDQQIVFSNEPVECLICLTTMDTGDAVRLQDCLHSFCKECLRNHVLMSNEASIRCPFTDDICNCLSTLRDREIKAMLSDHEYQQFLSRSLSVAENQCASSTHCKTPDCIGWCEFADGVNMFHCPVCKALNCLTCQAIHYPCDCKQYQDSIRKNSSLDNAAKKTQAMLDQMIKLKDALHCPQCNIIIMRKDGCDWVKCTMCKLEICWVTKGPRWGPAGTGDRSGGCHCKEDHKKCHPDCVNCH